MSGELDINRANPSAPQQPDTARVTPIQTDIRRQYSPKVDEAKERREAEIIGQIGWKDSKRTNYDGHSKRTRITRPDGTIQEQEEIITHLDTENYEPVPPPPTLIVKQDGPPEMFERPRPRRVEPEPQPIPEPPKKPDPMMVTAVVLLGILVFVAVIALLVSANRPAPTVVAPPAYAPPERTAERVIEVPVEKVIYRDRVVEKPIYVDRVVEKVVYRDRIVEKPVYRDRIVEVPKERVAQRVSYQPPVPVHDGYGLSDEDLDPWFRHPRFGLIRWDPAEQGWVDPRGVRVNQLPQVRDTSAAVKPVYHGPEEPVIPPGGRPLPIHGSTVVPPGVSPADYRRMFGR